MTDTGTKYDLFISYNWRDHTAVESVAKWLCERRLKVFLDRWYLVPGRPWPRALEEALRDCRAVAVFLGPHGMGPWQQREQDLALDRQSRDSGLTVIPVLLPGSDPALGFLSLNTWIDLRSGLDDPSALGILEAAVLGKTPSPDLQERMQAALASVCPFRGLRPFREEDASFFFGRDSYIDQLQRKLKVKSLVAVVGASGSGKSSVVRAGFVPALRRDVDDTIWDIATILPGDRPIHALAAALIPMLEPEMTETDRLVEVGKLADSLAKGTVALRDVISRVLEKQPGTDRLLLVVDQWEELYTHGSDSQTEQQFVGALLTATEEAPLSVVLTLRADFVGRVLGYRPLADRLQDALVTLGPMTREELEQVVVKPAEKIGLTFQSGLINRLLDDVGSEPGKLPLLEFVLTGLWERRRGGQLLHEAYDAMDGMEGSIAKRADEICSKLEVSEQAMVRWIFLQLVRPGTGTEDTRRRATIQEIGERARPLLVRLAKERLLVTSRDESTDQETVEVAHEALIRHWGQLRQWLEEDREFLMWLQRLRAALDEWEHTGRDADTLLRGVQLAEAEEQYRKHTLSANEREFIEESLSVHERQERSRRRRVAITRLVAVLMAILAFGASLAGWYAYKRKLEAEVATEHAESQSRIALARQLAAQSELISQYPDALQRSTLLAVESIRRHPSLEADQALRNRLAILPRLVRDVVLEHGNVISASNSTAGYLATRTNDKTVKIWEMDTGRLVATLDHGAPVREIVFTPDGRQFVTFSEEAGGTIGVWETAGGALTVAISGVGDVQDLASSADGKYLAAIIQRQERSDHEQDSAVRLWDAVTGALLAEIPHEKQVHALAFSPDGQYLAFGGNDFVAHLWELKSRQEISAWPHRSSVGTIAFSPNGRYLAAASFGKTQLTDLKNQKTVWLDHEYTFGSELAFRADGKYLATAGGDGTVQVWDAAGGQEVAILRHHRVIHELVFSRNNEYLATVTSSGTVRLWKQPRFEEVARIVNEQPVGTLAFVQNGTLIGTGMANVWRLWQTEGQQEVAVLPHGYEVNALAVSPRGKYLATGTSGDGTVRIWKLPDARFIKKWPRHHGEIEDLDFAPDGTKLAVVSLDGTLRVSQVPDGAVLKELDLDVSLRTTAFDPNDKSLAVGTQRDTIFGRGKNSVVLLDPSDWHELQEIRYEGAVTDLAYSPDGLLLAVATQTELRSEREENGIRFWPLGDTAEKAELRHEGEVNAVAFHPDGTRIAAAVYDRESRRGAAIIADPSEGKIVQRLEHEAAVSAITFSPDGRHLATASADGAAHVWDVERVIRIARVEHESSVSDIKFTPDSHYLITASADGTVRMWLWRPEDLVNEACARLSRNLTAEEWAQYLGDEAYRRTCSDLPTHYSMISAALKLARSGDVEAAIDQLQIIETSEPDLVPDALRMARQAAAEGLRARGQEAGIAGDMEHAIELFERAADLDPALGIDAQAEARRFAARGLVSRAETHARQGSIEDAIAAMQRAEALNANEVSAMAWNDLCWYGSLHEQAAAVMFACEKAVSLDPENVGIRDSRGLARALTGDREGAIDDFRFFVTQGQGKRQRYVLEQREQWIRQFEAGEDPFDRQTLKQLGREM